MNENIKDEFSIVQQQMQRHIDNNDAILCIPSLPQSRIPRSMYVPALQSVRISPDPQRKEVYPGSTKGKFRLHKKALNKISQAGDIVPFPERSGPVRIPGFPGIVAYKAVAGIRDSMGVITPHDGYMEIDIPLEKEIIIEQNESKKAGYNKKNPDWWKRMSPEAKDNYIDNCIQKEYIALRKYAPEKSETGAKNRLIRSLFPDLADEFTVADLQKPFVVLKWRLNLDHEDPEIRAFIKGQQRKSAMDVFGPNTAGGQLKALPTPMNQTLPQAINPEDDPNLKDMVEPEPEPDQAEEQPLTKAKADFQACDHKGKIEVLEELMKKKDYPASELNHSLSSQIWVDHPESLDRLYDHLSTLPDAVDEIPY